MLELKDICKSYKIGPTEVPVLKGISLLVEKGEMLSIVGASGSGKSTIMNIIGLLDKPTSGSYILENTNIVYDNDRFLSSIRNKKIGFVFQSYNLLQRLTALDNVGLPLVYRGIGEKEIRETAMEYLKKVDMHERAHHKPTELSGGQQQRVAVARALVGNPAIVLADEPTGALDTRVGQEIMNLFVRLNEEDGITVIIITHDPGVAAQCKRSVELQDGFIVRQRG
jgi:putative ABC transport system ATP-binding protein